MQKYFSILALLIYYLMPEIFEYRLNTHDITVLKIIIILLFVTPIIIFDKYTYSNLYIISFVLFYSVQSLFLIIFDDKFIILWQEINYFLLSYLALKIYQNSINNNFKIIANNLIFVGVLIITIILITQLFYNMREDYVFRPHFLIQLYILLLISGFELHKKNILLLLFIVLLFLASYQSRVAIISTLFIFAFRFGFLKTVMSTIILFPLIYIDGITDRINQLGLSDFGRGYIYNCVIENYSNLGLIIPSTSNFTECNIFGYTHSSHIEASLNFGLVLFITSLLIIINNFYKSIFIYKNKEIILGYLLFFIYGSVEGGLEWVYLFVIGKICYDRYCLKYKY